MTVDLDRLRAALDAAEQAARAVGGRWRVSPYWLEGSDIAEIEDAETGECVLRDDYRVTTALAAHIAAWDPARVLALIARDRATIDRHEAVEEFVLYGAGAGERSLACEPHDVPWPCPDVLAVAETWTETPVTGREIALPESGEVEWDAEPAVDGADRDMMAIQSWDASERNEPVSPPIRWEAVMVADDQPIDVCAVCPYPQRGHGQRWASPVGWHAWIEPDPGLVAQRVRWRRERRARWAKRGKVQP